MKALILLAQRALAFITLYSLEIELDGKKRAIEKERDPFIKGRMRPEIKATEKACEKAFIAYAQLIPGDQPRPLQFFHQ